MSVKSSMQVSVIFMVHLYTHFDRQRSSHKWLRKWCMGGSIIDMWVSLPIVVSSAAEVVE